MSEVIGGAERVLFEQSTRLAQRGHNVYILTRSLPGHQTNRQAIQCVKEWRYHVDLQKSAISFTKNTCQNGRALLVFFDNEYNFECISFYQQFCAFDVIQSLLSNETKRTYTCFPFSFEEFISRKIYSHWG